MPNSKPQTASNVALGPVTLSHETATQLNSCLQDFFNLYDEQDSFNKESWTLLQLAISNKELDFLESNQRGNLVTCINQLQTLTARLREIQPHLFTENQNL